MADIQPEKYYFTLSYSSLCICPQLLIHKTCRSFRASIEQEEILSFWVINMQSFDVDN